MRAVSLEVLRDKLRRYVRLASRGETILVTNRGRAVAEINPPAADRARHVADAHLAALVRDGLLRPPLAPRGTVPRHKPACATEKVLGELASDRSEA
jgi:antitoxin (DNA-binding transcriptional repressor) of toxin-antitoxin stability system